MYDDYKILKQEEQQQLKLWYGYRSYSWKGDEQPSHIEQPTNKRNQKHFIKTYIRVKWVGNEECGVVDPVRRSGRKSVGLTLFLTH